MTGHIQVILFKIIFYFIKALMDLNQLRKERQTWLTWKNIVPFQDAIKALPEFEDITVSLGDVVSIDIPNLTQEQAEQIRQTALLMSLGEKGHSGSMSFLSIQNGKARSSITFLSRTLI